jgi:alkanesulfonate monooxygenase SsuD/methylene tetrahydromethanopterin reductase-like flavin-dependent oxidoreductase (luciferase family)
MEHPLRVGVQLPEVEREVRWPELAAMARLVEVAGFDSLWVGDHLLYDRPPLGPRGPWEAWTQLAAVAAVTERVTLGPLVACAGFHDPAMLAKLAATVDEVSGGRLVVGLGAGWNRTEFDAFGFPYDRRVERFEEAFTIIRGLLAGERVTFAGRHHRVDGAVLLPASTRAGGPPLMIGSTRPRMLAATIAHVDVWNAWWVDFDNDPAGIAALRDRVDAACEQVGRDPDEVERTVAVLMAPLGDAARVATPGRRAAPALGGSPAELAATLAAFAAEGIAHVQLVLDPITLPAIEAAAGVLAQLRA